MLENREIAVFSFGLLECRGDSEKECNYTMTRSTPEEDEDTMRHDDQTGEEWGQIVACCCCACVERSKPHTDYYYYYCAFDQFVKTAGRKSVTSPRCIGDDCAPFVHRVRGRMARRTIAINSSSSSSSHAAATDAHGKKNTNTRHSLSIVYFYHLPCRRLTAFRAGTYVG